MSATSAGVGGGTPAIPSKGEFALRTNLALEASLRRLHSFAYARRQVDRLTTQQARPEMWLQMRALEMSQ